MLEAAGLLLSIVFHGGILTLFKVPAQLCEPNPISTALNDSITDNITDVTQAPSSSIAANVVIIRFIHY